MELNERSKEMKVLFGKRLKEIVECRLMKMVVEMLREGLEIEWWEEYEVLRRKFEQDVGSVDLFKNKITTKIENNWEEEVYTKSSFKWYKLAKDGTRYRNM